MDIHPYKDNAPVRIRVRPAATHRPWQDLWAWLLSPPDLEMTAPASNQTDKTAIFDDANPRQEPPHPQEKENVQDHHFTREK